MVRTLYDTGTATLPEGRADFLLAASVTRTCEIPRLTQAGIPGNIPLTPTLDAELLCNGRVDSLDNPAETASGIPTPGLLTRAVHERCPFARIRILDLGTAVTPQHCDVHTFGIDPTPSITEAVPFDAQRIFNEGRAFGAAYTSVGDYVIFGESTPGGTTTAQAAVAALGYETQGRFASSFKTAPAALKHTVINAALAKLDPSMDPLTRLGHTADNTLMFAAGFLLEASRRFPVVLGGGTQMAAALLIADTLATKRHITFDPDRITLCTTRWIARDGASDISALLAQLSFRPQACYADFSYADATIPVLRLYDEGEAKEGVGAGAALAYGFTHKLTQSQITEQVEAIMRRTQ